MGLAQQYDRLLGEKNNLLVANDALRAELREYGAWDDEQLADDAANWDRIVWIAAGDILEAARQHHA